MKTDLINNQKDLYELQNPEIEVVFIYGNHLNTELGLQFQRKNLIKERKKDDFLNPKVFEYTRGDETIPSYSVILPAVKWGYQYLFENQDKKYKPIKMLEYCADYRYSQ